MGTCEMCGIQTDNLINVKTVGSEIKVCSKCSRMGKTLEHKGPVSHSFYKNSKKEDVSFEVISNYQSLINSTLAKKNLTIHHLANTLNIKESTLNKILTGKFAPEISIARKIENFLDIKLVIESTNSSKNQDVDDLETEINDDINDSKMNLADLIKEKLRGKN